MLNAVVHHRQGSGRALTATEEALYDAFCAPARSAYLEAEERRQSVSTFHAAEDEPWMVVMSAPNCEERVRDELVRRGFAVWYPMRRMTIKSRHMKRAEDRTCPAYPGYLFVRRQSVADWQMMIGVDGLRAILKAERYGDLVPAQVRHAEIIKLMIYLEPLAMPVVTDAVRIGDRVVIADGPFISFQAIVERICGHDRLVVEVTLFGRPMPVELSRDEVAAC